MVDCGNPRCLQEKRHFRKELLSWGKKIPYAIGLELVAESLAGSGKIRTLLLPFNDLEPKKKQDWFPKQVEPLGRPSLQPYIRQSSWCVFCEESPLAPLGDANPQSPFGCRSEVEQGPATPESEAELDTAVMGTSVNHVPSCSGLRCTRSVDEDCESPLDLSSSTLRKAAASVEEHYNSAADDRGPDARVAPELRVPEVHRVKKKKEAGSSSNSTGIMLGPQFQPTTTSQACSKRAYTETELRAAVEAIQSGAVGTRRAAQMYGVPRSTLRNKVFKAAEMGQCSPPPTPGSSYPACGSEGVAARVHGGAGANGAQAPAHRQPCDVKQEAGGAEGADEEDTWIKKLQHLRHKHNLNAARGAAAMDAFGNGPFGYFGFNPFFLSPYAFDYSYATSSGLLMPYLPDLVKNLTHKRLELERSRCVQSQPHQLHHFPLPGVGGASPSKPEVAKISGSDADDDLKVPLYRPSASCNIAAPSSSRDSDCNSSEGCTTEGCGSQSGSVAIDDSRHGLDPGGPAKGLSANEVPLNLSSATTCEASGGCSVVPKDAQPLKKGKRSLEEMAGVSSLPGATTASQSLAMPHQTVSQAGGSKNKRPKRGQYRKYDSELLAQAVRAVQRGEMSVHRAGTYFGVPHSTLEYKVKERHLLRKKKLAAESAARSIRRPDVAAAGVGSASDADDMEGAAASIGWLAAARNGASRGSPRPTHKEGNSLAQDGAACEGVPSAGPAPSSGFALSTPASELLKKLQACANGRSALPRATARPQEVAGVDVQ